MSFMCTTRMQTLPFVLSFLHPLSCSLSPPPGLIIVMSEALSDDSMFSVLMVATVWEVDQFYSIYCRQDTSKMYFPW